MGHGVKVEHHGVNFRFSFHSESTRHHNDRTVGVAVWRSRHILGSTNLILVLEARRVVARSSRVEIKPSYHSTLHAERHGFFQCIHQNPLLCPMPRHEIKDTLLVSQ